MVSDVQFPRSCCLAPLFVAIACGGVAQQSSGHGTASAGNSQIASGGDEPGHATLGGAGSGSANAVPGGSGGSAHIDVPVAGSGGAPPGIRDGNACQFDPPSCNVLDQFIELENGARLPYPLDTSCGWCSSKCEVCDELTCSLWAQARTGCGTFFLEVAACAGLEGKPPCLNTAANAHYYVDASGKMWDQVTLTGIESQLPDLMLKGPVVVELTLTIGDGLTSQTIAARAHLCASFTYSLVICN